jgi:thiol reductant ABC exporter CydC subunit
VTRAGAVVDVARLAGLRPRRLVVPVVLGVLGVLAGAALVGLSGYLICRASQRPPILSLTVLVVGVRAVALARPLARYAERLSAHDLAFRTLRDVRAEVFAAIEPRAPEGLEHYRDGDLLSRMVADVDEMQDLVLRIVVPLAIALPAGAVLVVATGVLSPPAAAVLAAGLALGAVVPPWAAHHLAVRERERQAALRATLTADLVDALDAGPELWLNGAEEAAESVIADDDRALVAAAAADARGAGWADLLGTVIAGGTALAVLLVTAAAAGDGRLSTLLVAPLTFVALAAFEAVTPLAAAARSLPSVLAAGARVRELTGRPPLVTDPARPRPAPGRRPALDLRDVRVLRGRERRPVLDGVDLAVAPGERVVVTGPSGAGKSTLLSVLVRFLERDGGQASLDGHELRDHAQRDVRDEVLFLAQDPYVFDSDIRENVAFARPGATDAEIREALRRARLGEWVESLDDGLRTRVGERGRALSGGQRQRLALARAFLADPSVLLLDEPTAHLDARNASALLADLWATAGDRSVVLVTHGPAGPFAAGRTVAIRPRPGDFHPNGATPRAAASLSVATGTRRAEGEDDGIPQR